MRISRRPSTRQRGFTLLEAIVVMGIMVVILGAAHTFLASGVGFYVNSVQGLEVQQQAMVGLTRMMDEMETSNFDSFLLEPSGVIPADPQNATVPRDPPLPPGIPLISTSIIFPSIFDLNGDFNTTEFGKPLWNTMVCFMPVVAPDGTFNVERRVDTYAPTAYLPDPTTFGTNQGYFGGIGATGVVARNVKSLVAISGTDAIDVHLRVTFSQRSEDNMRIESRVFPTN